MNDESLTPEDVAAFIDGTLPPAERARVMAILLRSPEAFEVYADAARIAAELAVESTTIARGRWRRRGRFALRAAAIIALLAVPVSIVWLRDASSPLDALHAGSLTTDAAGSIATAVASRLAEPGWSVLRGPADLLTDEQRAFRIGVRLVDFRIALEADLPLARAAGDELFRLLRDVDGASTLAARVQALQTQPAPGRAASRTLANLARQLDAFPAATWLRLGVWSEQAALAVGAARSDFIARSGPRLDDLIGRMTGDATPAAQGLVPLLRRMRDHIGQTSSPDLPFIRESTQAIMRTGGG